MVVVCKELVVVGSMEDDDVGDAVILDIAVVVLGCKEVVVVNVCEDTISDMGVVTLVFKELVVVDCPSEHVAQEDDVGDDVVIIEEVGGVTSLER